MRFHCLTPPHAICNKDYVACAYTQKALKFAKMMTQRGHEVYTYSIEGMETASTEDVVVVDRETYDRVYGTHDFHSQFFKYDINDEVYQTYNRRAVAAILARRQTNDFILPFWGYGNKAVCDQFPDLITVEPGIGYASGHWARWKIFESYAIYHAYCGLASVGNCRQDSYESVIPNSFDPEDFEYGPEPGLYVLYLGRVYDGKGVNIAIQATERSGHRLVIAGQNAREYFAGQTVPDHVDIFGHADHAARKRLYRDALCTFVASQYLEPFGGVMVESMMSGTPIITADWGAATEINLHGETGYRCRTMADYVWALATVDKISRPVCRGWAVDNYSLTATAPKYEAYFQQVLDVYTGQGWYEPRKLDGIELPVRKYPYGLRTQT